MQSQKAVRYLSSTNCLLPTVNTDINIQIYTYFYSSWSRGGGGGRRLHSIFVQAPKPSDTGSAPVNSFRTAKYLEFIVQLTSCRFVTSHWMVTALPPSFSMSAFTSDSLSSLLAVIATDAPATANCLATASPIPLDAPVTMATLPVSGAIPEKKKAEI